MLKNALKKVKGDMEYRSKETEDRSQETGGLEL
jgi:hypothetical protein